MTELLTDHSKSTPNNKISRYTSSPGNQQKVDWLADTLKQYGMSVKQQSFSARRTQANNVIGTFQGSDSNSLYTISAHIDSNVQDGDATAWAPGANDNGSGVVVIMEVARLMNAYKGCLKSSVDVVAFNDEENSMQGSPTYIESISSKTFKGGWNLDMVGIAQGGACIENKYNSSKDKFLADKITQVGTTYGIDIELPVGTYDSPDIDGYKFWEAGLPQGHLVECANDPNYHSTNDVAENLDYPQLAKTAQVVFAATAELASQ